VHDLEVEIEGLRTRAEQAEGQLERQHRVKDNLTRALLGRSRERLLLLAAWGAWWRSLYDDKKAAERQSRTWAEDLQVIWLTRLGSMVNDLLCCGNEVEGCMVSDGP
jgi:hypothetical protein